MNKQLHQQKPQAATAATAASASAQNSTPQQLSKDAPGSLLDASVAAVEAGSQLNAPADYTSAFPNVGLVVWQAGFVLADYLLRDVSGVGSWKGGYDAGGRCWQELCQFSF
jgi:hypothetical protein